MKEYDVFIAGGGISGSIAAKFTAKLGLNTLFIEKYKTPRNKPCSGIQFNYFEKFIGEKIPKEKLCNQELNRVEMMLPNGKTFGSSFKMFNFMRDIFDDWLNQVAQNYGAEFRDECEFVDFTSIEDSLEPLYEVTIKNKNDLEEKIRVKYIIDATGLRPVIRKKLKPEDFKKGSSGATLNYYIDGNGGNLDPNTLYQFWNIEFNNMMFAWVYTKTINGKDLWVVGTGYDKDIKEHQDKFYNFIRERYGLTGEIVKKEGYSSNIDFESNNRIWLGENNILMVGDAAGLVDITRGVGMDAAALSGRLAAKAILKAKQNKTVALNEYTKLMNKLVKQTKKNQTRQITQFSTNEELQNHLNKNLIKMGLGMILQNLLNKFRSAERQVMLPP